jgi:hypothetical protein
MAACAPTVAYTEYRIVLILPGSRALLSLHHHNGAARLPRVRVPARSRPTPRLQKTIESTWGVRGVVLDYWSLEESLSPCAVIELLSEDLTDGLYPVVPEQLADDELSEKEQTFLMSLFRGEAASPLCQMGWLQEAVSWVEETAGDVILSMQQIEQLNAGGGFMLLRFPMQSGRSYWLKATAAPNSHERSVASCLSKLCPGHVPEVLSIRPDWNAWIMQDVQSTDEDFRPHKGFQMLECAVTSMAELQLKTIGREAALLEAGAFDQRLNVLRKDSHLLFQRIDEAMSRQTSTKATCIRGDQLRNLRDVFDATCDFVETLAIPTTVLHGDMNAGNLLYCNGHCQFIDWSEAYVGCPLVTLQHLLLLNQETDARLKSELDHALIDRYRLVVREVCDPTAMDMAIVCMPLIAAASTAYGRGVWLQSSLANSSRRQVYVRTMARHMLEAASTDSLLDALAKDRFACAE